MTDFAILTFIPDQLQKSATTWTSRDMPTLAPQQSGRWGWGHLQIPWQGYAGPWPVGRPRLLLGPAAGQRTKELRRQLTATREDDWSLPAVGQVCHVMRLLVERLQEVNARNVEFSHPLPRATNFVRTPAEGKTTCTLMQLERWQLRRKICEIHPRFNTCVLLHRVQLANSIARWQLLRNKWYGMLGISLLKGEDTKTRSIHSHCSSVSPAWQGLARLDYWSNENANPSCSSDAATNKTWAPFKRNHMLGYLYEQREK